MCHGGRDGERADDRHAAKKKKSSDPKTAMPSNSPGGHERRLSQQYKHPAEEERGVDIDEQTGKRKILCSKSYIFRKESVEHRSADQHRHREKEGPLRVNTGVWKRALCCPDRAQVHTPLKCVENWHRSRRIPYEVMLTVRLLNSTEIPDSSTSRTFHLWPTLPPV